MNLLQHGQTKRGQDRKRLGRLPWRIRFWSHVLSPFCGRKSARTVVLCWSVGAVALVTGGLLAGMLLAAGEVKSVPRAAYAIFKCSRGKPSILGISLIPLSSGRWTSQALLGGQDLPPGMRVRIYDSIKGEYVCDERRADGSWSTNATFGLGTGFTVLVPESAPKASYDICLAGEMLLRDSVTNRLALSRGLSSDWCPIPRACPGCRDLTSRLRIAINAGMEQDAQVALARRALVLLCERCPRLVGLCYWAGTAAIATEELHHRQSFDLIFTRAGLWGACPLFWPSCVLPLAMVSKSCRRPMSLGRVFKEF